MKKIKITTPNKNSSKWQVSWGKGGIRKRNNPTIIFNAIERKLLRLQLKENIEIVVKYDKDIAEDFINESLPSCNAKYLLYSLLCFLEDYLPNDFIRRKLKNYQAGVEII